MTAEHWQTKENAEFLRQLGFYHGLIRLNSGLATLKGVTFGDGTIDAFDQKNGLGFPLIADPEHARAAKGFEVVLPVGLMFDRHLAGSWRRLRRFRARH